MAGQPHIATGECKVCGHKFTPASMTLCINYKEKGLVLRKRVCGKCYSEHMSKGE